ncbi:hypothetical protein WK13_28185 [Burkholderia ubonensis]|nr:hypothetical protein WK13_28185 [Burkholderia ubonensis]
MTVLGAVVHGRRSFDKYMPHMREFRNVDLGRRIAALVIGDDFEWRRAGTQHSLENAFGGGFIAPFLQQHIEFGAVLVDNAP